MSNLAKTNLTPASDTLTDEDLSGGISDIEAWLAEIEDENIKKAAKSSKKGSSKGTNKDTTTTTTNNEKAAKTASKSSTKVAKKDPTSDTATSTTNDTSTPNEWSHLLDGKGYLKISFQALVELAHKTSPQAMYLYIVLLGYVGANTDKVCWPSGADLQKVAKINSHHTLTQYIAQLVEQGYITYEEKTLPGKTNKRKVFCIKRDLRCEIEASFKPKGSKGRPSGDT